MDQNQIYQHVQDHYSYLSQGKRAEYGETVAKSFGYSQDELAATPKEANLGLSCGNPLAIASLCEGETVIDLGSGAGFDVFLAAKKVGATGRVFGVDMNKDMLARANENKAKVSAQNVDFVEATITSIPLESDIASCIISNCVINLVPKEDKPIVFKEMFRLLKSGGRVAISDILAKQPLPNKIRKDVALYCGCIAGASQVYEYDNYLRQAGFHDILIVDSPSDLNVYMDTDNDGTRRAAANACCAGEPAWSSSCCPDSCCGGEPPSSCCSSCSTKQPKLNSIEFKAGDCCSKELKTGLPASVHEIDINEWAESFKIYAVKPE